MTDTPPDYSKTLRHAVANVPNADDRLQTIAEIKTLLADWYCKLAGEALAFTGEGAGGAVAHTMRTSTQEVTTWAKAYETFGPDFINAESDPLDHRWWCAILKTDDPHHWLEQARTRQLGAAQIRAEAGVKQERKPPWYEGGGTYAPEKLAIYLDAEPPDTEGHRLEIRARVKDD